MLRLPVHALVELHEVGEHRLLGAFPGHLKDHKLSTEMNAECTAWCCLVVIEEIKLLICHNAMGSAYLLPCCYFIHYLTKHIVKQQRSMQGGLFVAL